MEHNCWNLTKMPELVPIEFQNNKLNLSARPFKCQICGKCYPTKGLIIILFQLIRSEIKLKVIMKVA